MLNSYTELNDTDKENIITSIGENILNLIGNIDSIQALRNSKNQARYDCPPTTPADIAKLSGKEFSMLISNQKRRLTTTFNEQSINQIEDEFQDFKSIINRNNLIETIAVEDSSNYSFKETWNKVEIYNEKISNLKEFIGGLYTVFSSTSTVESDFSVIAYEKNDYRSQLSNLSLEGILHSKQYNLLKTFNK